MFRRMKAAWVLLCLTAVTVSAAPPMRPVTVKPVTTKPLTAQQVAQMRADWMVRHSHRWHPPFSVGRVFKHCRFEGVGWGRAGLAHKRMGTCLPRWRMTLVGDAYATNGRMSARVRLWK